MSNLRRVILGLGAASAVFAFTAPAQAQVQDVDGLGCMEAGYSAEENAELDALFADFGFGDGAGNEAANKMSAKAAPATVACLGELGWNVDSLFPALLYEVGRLSELGHRASGSLSLENQEKLDAALANGDHSSLWASLEKAVIAGIRSEEPDLTTGESLAMGLFVLGAGISGGDAEKVGELLGFMALQSFASKEFANIQAGGEPSINLD